MAFTFGNDKNILQETDILYVNAGAGDDKYILAPNKLSAGQTINITDTQGTNTIQLIGGLIFTKSLFALDALQLTLSNGAILNVLGAADFSYEIGGDPLSGKQGIVTDYSGFAMAFGSSVPATGINQSTGGTVSSDGTIKTSQVDPVFSDDFYSFSVPEDRVQGYEVGQVQASDANSDTLTYSINSGNELGYFAINSSTGAISLTSAANNKLNYEGIKNFDLGVLVLDGKGGQDAAQVSIAVTNINEAPEFNNSTPFEFEARLNAAAGEQIGNINAVDVDAGDSLTYSIINGDANGYFSIDTNGIITLTSAGVGKITGSYTLEVKAADAGGKSDQTTVIIEVGNADLGPVFDASAYMFNIAENSASNTTVGVVTAKDPENTAVLSYAITSGNDAGLFEINSSTGKITLTDDGASVWNYEGATKSYSLTVSATDTAFNQSTIAPVTVKITNVNEAPEFGTVAGITTNEDVVSTGTLTVTDVDAGDTLAFSTVTSPIHGTLTVNASSGAYTYTPASNYFGTDTFKIKVTDAGGLSASKSVDITINPVNDPPTTADQSFQTGQNITTPPIPFNATDVDSTNLTYNIVKQPLNGIITINSDGKFTFDPDTLFYGIDRFFYTVSDGTSTSAEQIIYLSVSDAITGTDSDDRILGLSQSDAIYGGDGNDTIRGGKGVDQINGGEGDDKIVIVGDLRGGGKIDTDEDTAILGEPLTNYNGLDFNEDENGSNELIDGGNGNDTLYIYGTADVSKSNLSGIENVVIRSDVTFPGGFIQGLDSITGDGSSVIRIKADPGKTIELDFSSLGIELKDIGMIEVGENVTIVVHDLDDLGGARTLVGNGQIKAAEGVGALDLTGFITTKDLTILNEDGSSSTGATEIGGVFIHSSGQNELTGTDNDDIIDGSDQPEVFDGKKGNDVLSGGAGDDKFIIADSGRKTILDTRGTDTIDCSKAGGAAIVDLSNGGTVGGATLVLGSGETATGRQPIDLYLLQDLSGSFRDDVNTVRSLISGDSGLIASVRKLQSDTNFGVGSFVDKPTGGFGSSGDYVYKTQLAMARSETEFANTVNSMVVLSGADGPEAQLEALFQTALRADSEVGFRLGALRVVLLTTDAPFHKAGDFSGAIPNNGDTVLDGAGTTEDYPTIEQVREAISDSSIYPVFAVTSENVSTYNELVTQLGTGSVVTLSSDSSNIINVITTALGTVKRDFIENFTGTDFDDTITLNSLNNYIDGGSGIDTVILSGNESEYTLTTNASTYTVSDTVPNRDGTNILKNIEQLQFADNTVDLQPQSTLVSTDDLFTYYKNTVKTESNIDTEGYYELFFHLSNASYYHEDSLVGITGMDSNTPADNSKKSSHESLEDSGIHFVTSTELGIDSGDNNTPHSGDKYAYSNGYYISYETTEIINNSSSAMVTRSADSLFLTFRGTDVSLVVDDWYDDFVDMEGHYARYYPLFQALDNYIQNEGIKEVYVSGHSLGGQMAANYMEEEASLSGVEYKAVTFEAANNSLTSRSAKVENLPNPLITNFEMYADPVPDLSLETIENYGNSIFLDYEGYEGLLDIGKSHGMDAIAPYFSLAASVLNAADTDSLTAGNNILNQRVYVDTNNDNLIETRDGTEFLKDLTELAVGEWAGQLLGAVFGPIGMFVGGKLGAAGITEIQNNDDAEYQSTEYNINVVYQNGASDTTLVIDPIDSLNGIKDTFILKPENDIVKNIIISDDFVLSENTNIKVDSSITKDKVLVGNAGNNNIQGSGGNDILIGGADKDYLYGNSGDDILFGGKYEDLVSQHVVDPIDGDIKTHIANYANGFAVDDEDVSYLRGGDGQDTMYGTEGDNDFFIIDINSKDVDTIEGFYISSLFSDPFKEDYLVFSAQQLGVTVDDLDAVGVSGVDVAGITGHYLSSLNFISINDGSYDQYDGDNNAPQFILNINNGYLYFDKDGSNDVGDELKLAEISAASNSTKISADTFDANNIIIVGSFDGLNDTLIA